MPPERDGHNCINSFYFIAPCAIIPVNDDDLGRGVKSHRQPGNLGCVPVKVSHREAMMDANIGALDAAEEALDVVRVGPAVGLVD